MKKYALVSVSDKNGITAFCKGLTELGYEIISTGGTQKELEKNGIKTVNISDITGFPECLDGRVKTLDPHVHAGILAMRSNKSHMEQLQNLNINTIDIVVVNLYPFKATIESGADFKEAVENIDIGGPTMLRSAAKNYQDVAVICDPADYEPVLEKLNGNGLELEYRKNLMYKVFSHTASYDALIAEYLQKQTGVEFPDTLTMTFTKAQDLRYGENPHQKAVFYREPYFTPYSISAVKQLHGKELSFNNINDTSSALDLLKEFTEPCAVAVKHTNPCGVAIANTVSEAFRKAKDADPISIFGGIIAVNRPVTVALAEQISKIFVEIVIAPSYEKDAFAILSKKADLRLLELDGIEKAVEHEIDIKKVSGGMLLQKKDKTLFFDSDIKIPTKRQPTIDELKQLKFAFSIVKHCKSNAIVLAKNFASMGIGVGQTNRIWATNQAIENCMTDLKGAVMASDAFFPFGDCCESAQDAGITAVIHPGGSKNDALSVEVCDKYNMAMVVCGMRHFKH